uniref:Immunoglobulin V-set domain-containing protein n=1 Tax=Salarias fasciatus TaxID=181472 RepID=A0A672IR99_SALFA
MREIITLTFFNSVVFSSFLFCQCTFNVREDVTLACSHWTAVGGVLFWKKLVPGSLPEVLGATYTFNHVAVHRRPRTETKQEHGAFVLRIAQTELDDTAFYYCELFCSRFPEPETEITAIFQYFEAAVGAENTVKLQCSVFFDVQKEKTCPGGHKVLWFTPELNKTHPSVTYIHHVEECDREAELDSPQKCVYNLSQFDIKSSHTGAFYRAVVTSEEMLCGKRLKVEKDNEGKNRTLTYILILPLMSIYIKII